VDHEKEAIDYVVDKFRNFGVVVETSGVRAIPDYMDEYYEKVYQNNEDGITVLYFTQDDVEAHIASTRPDIPAHVVQTILHARQEYIDGLYAMGREGHE